MSKLKFLIIPILWMAVASCSDNQDVFSPSESGAESTYRTQLRSAEDAIGIAIAAASDSSITNNTSRGNINKFSVKSVKIINTHASRHNNDSLVYAVDFENNAGFALVSAPKTVEPLLAFVEQGNSDDPQTLLNEGYQFALNQTIQYVQEKSSKAEEEYRHALASSQLPITPMPGPDHYTDTIFPTPKTTPSVEVSWGQEWPENIYCPNQVAGCVPVAIAQILSYYEKPTSIAYTFAGKDKTLEAIKWADIKKHIKSTNYTSPSVSVISNHFSSCNASEEKHKSLARLVREIGEKCNSIYYDAYVDEIGVYHFPATSTPKLNGPEYLSKVLNKTANSGNSALSLFQCLQNNQRPAYVRASIKGTSEGHAWVADATWQIGMVIEHYTLVLIPKDQIGIGKEEYYYKVTREGTMSSYIHYNWGWSGNSNGYFLVNIFNPSKGYEYDNDDPYTSDYDFGDSFNYWIY